MTKAHVQAQKAVNMIHVCMWQFSGPKNEPHFFLHKVQVSYLLDDWRKTFRQPCPTCPVQSEDFP